MKLFKKNNQKKKRKVVDTIVWERYINARSMKDQTLAKQIAEEYGIDYDCFPVLEKDVLNKISLEIENTKRYQREKEIREIVVEVLKENNLLVD